MDQIIAAVVAIIGVPLILLGYMYAGEWLIERLPGGVQVWIRPYFWALPAIGFAGVFMVFPLVKTVYLSFRNGADTEWFGFNNYIYFFTFPDTLTSLRNSVLWLIFYTLFAAVAFLLEKQQRTRAL